MKFWHVFFILIGFSFLTVACGGGGSGGNDGGGTRTTFSKVSFPLTVRAQIDGRSHLKIKGNMIWWHHFDFQPPGLWDEDDKQATLLNKETWNPEWPEGDLTNCDCESSKIEALETPLRADATAVSISVVSARGQVTIVEQPNQGNDFTAVIEFDDNIFPEPDFYEIIISYN